MKILKINFWYYAIFMLLILTLISFVANVNGGSNADKLISKAKSYSTSLDKSFNKDGIQILQTRKVINRHELDSLPEYRDISALNLQKLSREQSVLRTQSDAQSDVDNNLNTQTPIDSQGIEIATQSGNQ